MIRVRRYRELPRQVGVAYSRACGGIVYLYLWNCRFEIWIRD